LTVHTGFLVFFLIKNDAILSRVPQICELILKLLKRKKTEAIIVFDGLPLPGKVAEQARRSRVTNVL
jgi:hypothetical protein